MIHRPVRFLVIAGLLISNIASLSYAQGNNTAQAMRNIRQAQGTLDKMTKVIDGIEARKKRKAPVVRTQRTQRTAPIQRLKRQPNAPKPKP